MTMHDQIALHGIVLAAGRSQRAGAFKPAHVHAGKPLVVHAVDGLLPWCRSVIVVGGYRHELVRDLVRSRRHVMAVLNPDHDRGLLTSLQAGFGAIGLPCDGIFVLPVDCPLVSPAVYGAMIAAFVAQDRAQAVVPEYRGRDGHPLLLPAAARSCVPDLGPGGTLRDCIRRTGAVRLPVDDPAILMDLNTREDLRALAAHAPDEGPPVALGSGP